MHIPKIAKHFLIIIVLILSINSCTNKQENILGSENQNRICIYLDGNDLKYNTDIPIAGFQFNHNGCILNISGGTPVYTINAFGLSLTLPPGVSMFATPLGAPIPAGVYPYTVTDVNSCDFILFKVS